MMPVEHFKEPAHVRAFLIVRKTNKHVHTGNRVLHAVRARAFQGNRIADVFDADLIDRYLTRVMRRLYVRHGLGHLMVFQCGCDHLVRIAANPLPFGG